MTEKKLWPNIPDYAWKIGMDKKLAEPSVSRKKNMLDGGYYQGVPLGGFGAGTIGRNYMGGFNRWTIKTGALKFFNLPANIFAVYQKKADGKCSARVLHPGYPLTHQDEKMPDNPWLSSWNWQEGLENGTYYGLFPKAWYYYKNTDDYPVEMICEQFSPVIPHNYRESTYPAAVFRWVLRNNSSQK
ncbi:MAG TPA: glucosylceramidase, partial [Spirochaetia bacterium]|nr:glucosylceramidase [Spirochaetia bacterium]